MKIHSINDDISNYKSNSYFQINSCGISSHNEEFITYRQNGRSDYQIMYIVSGECEITYQNEKHLMNKGFVIYPPNTTQKYIDSKNTKRFWVHFSGNSIEEILKDAGLKCGVHNISNSPLIEKLLIQLIAEHNKIVPISMEKVQFLNILYMLGKQINNTTANSKIEYAVNYITSHYNEKFSVKDLANLCNLSEGRFMHLFKQQIGISPVSYCQNLRIENAKTLLSSTNLRISEICNICGYDDPYYFSRIFKKVTNKTPKAYRINNTYPNEFQKI